MTTIKRVNTQGTVVKPLRWKPGSRLGKPVRPEGYRLRWCEDTPENIAKKKSDGWEILDKTKFPQLGATEYDKRVTDSEGETKSILKRNELVAMVMKEDLADARDQYHAEEVRARSNNTIRAAKNLVAKIDPRNSKNVYSITPEGNF